MQSPEVAKCKLTEGGWRVERSDHDGGVEITVFYGNNPHDRAHAYAKLLDF